MKKWDTRKLRTFKKSDAGKTLQMLTCYDFQTAQMLNETQLDLILVGDSLGNVVLGYDTTIPVTLDHMSIFAGAVKRGAPDKFIVADLPFGTYSSIDKGLENGIKLFQSSGAESIKLEGASEDSLALIRKLTETGIPVMGHIGLTPQSVHEMGGYYTHGKNERSAERLLKQAKDLQNAGVFALVLECVTEGLAEQITSELSIPTIGIGSGDKTDGQVLVTNDLLGMGKDAAPKFVNPITNLFELKKTAISKYLDEK
jgi:3-methyl-2-oxobutanoate hydroxymethyltransferase